MKTESAIENALKWKEGKSFSDGNMVVGISDPVTDEIAVSFGNTPGLTNMLWKLSRADASVLATLLRAAEDKLQSDFLESRKGGAL